MTIALGLVIFTNIYAQEQATSTKMWIGGQLSFTTNNTYTLGPSFGMMLTDVMAVGGTLTISDAFWAIEPYFRMYKPIKDNFKFYGDGYLSIGGGSSGATDYSSFGIGVRPGVQYWFTQQWSMAATLGNIGYSQTSWEGGTSDGHFALGIDFSSLHFAFFFHF